MNQGAIDSEHKLDPLNERRERVFLIFACVFVGAMAMLNVIGITRFVHIGPLMLAVGVLPYPLTFLCTDFISEFYGRRRANFVVTVGLAINGLVFVTLWLGDLLPSVTDHAPPWQMLSLASPISLPGGDRIEGNVETFHIIYACMRGSVAASMVAYLAAQFCDVYLFHFWKKLCRGKHLWLRNNGSTMVSQLVDATAVITITFGAQYLRGDMTLDQMGRLISDNYMFKIAVAALDTIPFYIGVRMLRSYLSLDPTTMRD
jgi:queuosine precursor transporter